MKILLSLFVSIISFEVYATKADCNDPVAPPEVKQMMTAAQMAAEDSCVNEVKLRGICAAVANKEESADGKYRYQKKILEAACVDSAKDSEQVIANKVSNLWNKHQDKFKCVSSAFDVENGNILKFAATIKFDQFLYDMVTWKVDLNKIDPADNRTTLDYIKDQIKAYKGTYAEDTLKSYYELLRNAGAKHRSEL